MPIDSLIVSICVVAMFGVFGGVLLWGDLRTRSQRLAEPSATKRRAF